MRRVCMLFLVLVGGCDTFSSVVVENRSSSAVRVRLTAGEPFHWRLCDTEEAVDAVPDVKDMEAEIPPGACVTYTIGNHGCATDEVSQIEQLTLARGGVECLSVAGDDSHARFAGDCTEMRMIVTDELCP